MIGGRLAARKHAASVPSSQAVATEETKLPTEKDTPETYPSELVQGSPAEADTRAQEPAPAPKKSVALPEERPKPSSMSPAQTKNATDTNPRVIKEASEALRPYFAVQVLSTQNLNDAREAEGRLKTKGFPAQVFEVDLGNKGKWYRVYVGPYKSEKEAEWAAKDVRANPEFQKSFVKFLEWGKDFSEPFERKESGK